MFTWFKKLTKQELKDIPYVCLYKDEVTNEVWNQYCEILEASPDCKKLTLVVAGVSEE